MLQIDYIYTTNRRQEALDSYFVPLRNSIVSGLRPYYREFIEVRYVNH